MEVLFQVASALADVRADEEQAGLSLFVYPSNVPRRERLRRSSVYSPSSQVIRAVVECLSVTLGQELVESPHVEV